MTNKRSPCPGSRVALRGVGLYWKVALRGVGLYWKVECKVESLGARLVLQAQPGARRGCCPDT